MKIRIAYLFVVFILVSTNFSQEKNSSGFLNSANFGVLGGINVSNMSNLGGAVQFEFKSNLSSVFLLKFSAAYHHVSTDESINIKRFGIGEIDGEQFFSTSEFEILGREYRSFPLSIGFQYLLDQSFINPYIIGEIGYNIIDAKSKLTPSIVRPYNSLEEIPDEYKEGDQSEPLPLSSLRYGFGLGGSFKITDSFALDVRYIFYIDTEIVDTHHFLVGIVL